MVPNLELVWGRATTWSELTFSQKHFLFRNYFDSLNCTDIAALCG